MAPTELEESWTMPKIQLGAAPLLHCSTLGDWRPGLGSSPPAIKSRARLVYLLPTAADCKYTVPGVLGILLVRTIINLGQWAATIGWSLLAKYRRSAMKKSHLGQWTLCRKGDQNAGQGTRCVLLQVAGFCALLCTVWCRLIIAAKKFHNGSQSNATLLV